MRLYGCAAITLALIGAAASPARAVNLHQLYGPGWHCTREATGSKYDACRRCEESGGQFDMYTVLPSQCLTVIERAPSETEESTAERTQPEPEQNQPPPAKPVPSLSVRPAQKPLPIQPESVRWPKPYMIGENTLVVSKSKPADSCLAVDPPREVSAFGGCVTKGGTKSHWFMTRIRSTGASGCPHSLDFSYTDPDDKSVTRFSTPFTAQTCGGPPLDVKVY